MSLLHSKSDPKPEIQFHPHKTLLLSQNAVLRAQRVQAGVVDEVHEVQRADIIEIL